MTQGSPQQPSPAGTTEPIDDGFDRLCAASDTISAAAGANEATTRLRAIDTVLFEALHWPRKHTELEKYCRTERFADYVLLHSGFPLAVVEAKREGEYSTLPDVAYDDKPRSFQLLASESKRAATALTGRSRLRGLGSARHARAGSQLGRHRRGTVGHLRLLRRRLDLREGDDGPQHGAAGDDDDARRHDGDLRLPVDQ